MATFHLKQYGDVSEAEMRYYEKHHTLAGFKRSQMTKPANRWQFLVGNRTVTVKATTYEKAVKKAREEADKRCEASGGEPPVSWSLELLRAYRAD